MCTNKQKVKKKQITMNFTEKSFSKAKGIIYLIAVLLMCLTASCQSDDDEKPNDGKYIVTNPTSNIGVTYAELSGEFYPNNLPKAYTSHGYEILVGVEISIAENFPPDYSMSGYIYQIEDSHLIATAYGLAPNTQYFYRMFVEVGQTRLYGEKLSFTTQAMELPCNVGDVTNVNFNTAEVIVNFNQQPSLSPVESFSYGVAWSTDKDIFSKTQNLLKEDGNMIEGLNVVPVYYSGMSTTATISGLESNTTYYYCAYVSVGTYGICQFGPVKSFTTGNRDGLMTIDNISPKFILAEISGTTKLTQQMTGLTYKLMCVRADDNWPFQNDVNMTINGDKLTAVVQSLYPNQTYKCWIAAIKDGNVVAESEKKEFTTENPGDYIHLEDATDITSTTATISCTLTGEGYETEQWCDIYYGKDKNNLLYSVLARKNGDKMTVILTDLQPNTTYYYCGHALCTLAMGYADWFKSDYKSFKTLP